MTRERLKVEFSIETYNNKRYGSHIELTLSDIEKGGELTLSANCFARLVRRNARLIDFFYRKAYLRNISVTYILHSRGTYFEDTSIL
jgi:hypothetical protein